MWYGKAGTGGSHRLKATRRFAGMCCGAGVYKRWRGDGIYPAVLLAAFEMNPDAALGLVFEHSGRFSVRRDVSAEAVGVKGC